MPHKLLIKEQQGLNQIAQILEVMASMGDQYGPTKESIFSTERKPSIGVAHYFQNFGVMAGLEDEQGISVLILIERFCAHATQKAKPLLINSLTIYR